MDKSIMDSIKETVKTAENIPDDVFNLVEACKTLMKEVERLEARHKADQKAVEEANQLAETYMKRCQELYDKLKKAEKSAGDIAKPVVDMLNRPADTHINVRFEKASLEYFSTEDIIYELMYHRGVKTSRIVPGDSAEVKVKQPSIIMIVNESAMQ